MGTTRIINTALLAVTFLASRGGHSEIHHAIARVAIWICGYGIITGSPVANLMWLVCFWGVIRTDPDAEEGLLLYVWDEANRILYRVIGTK